MIVWKRAADFRRGAPRHRSPLVPGELHPLRDDHRFRTRNTVNVQLKFPCQLRGHRAAGEWQHARQLVLLSSPQDALTSLHRHTFQYHHLRHHHHPPHYPNNTTSRERFQPHRTATRVLLRPPRCNFPPPALCFLSAFSFVTFHPPPPTLSLLSDAAPRDAHPRPRTIKNVAALRCAHVHALFLRCSSGLTVSCALDAAVGSPRSPDACVIPTASRAQGV